MTGVFPFGKNNHVEAKITSGRYNRGGRYPYLSPELKKLIDAGFTVNDSERITLDEVIIVNVSEGIDVEFSLDTRLFSAASSS